ncbi:MAG: GPP34 family phosphoprotein [Bacteroidota bacterium]|jgi:hypothetical protein
MMLSLAEKLLLIATNDEKGSLLMAGADAVPYGIAGALLLELHFKRRILLQEKRLVVIDRSPVDDPLCNEALELIATAAKAKDTKYWVWQIERKIRKINARVFESLVEKGILAKVEKHFLWVIPYSRYPERDSQPERLAKEKLYDAIRGRINPDEQLVSLLSLVNACGLLKEVVPEGERREAKKAVKKILADEKVGIAVKAVVDEIHAAVIAAVVAASVATSAASS